MTTTILTGRSLTLTIATVIIVLKFCPLRLTLIQRD